MPRQPGQTTTKREQYAKALYKYFDDNSTIQLYEGKEVKVWTGFITVASRNLGISMGEYSRVMAVLLTNECVTIEQRGAANTPSVLFLDHAPVDGSVAAVIPGLTRPLSAARLHRRVSDLENQLGGVDLKGTLRELHLRVSAIETALRKAGLM
jgi:hypothetical protein